MAIINQTISPRAFETIRDRIGAILAEELYNQSAITYDGDIDATVFVERFIPFDKTDMPCVNVLLSRGAYDNISQRQADGTYTFNIDCYSAAKTTSVKNGDHLAAVKLQKLLGVCWAILKDPLYNTLGYQKPFISHTEISEVKIADPVNNQDGSSVIMGRITFVVRVPELVKLISPILLAGYDTVMKLNQTNKGYFFSTNQPGVPVASFTTSPEPPTGTTPLTVAFTDTSTNTPTSWLWTVTGGILGLDYEYTVGSNISQNPTIKFNVSGNYSVTLTATNGVGSDVSDPDTISATGVVCADAVVENSDVSYQENIPSGDTLVLPDIDFEIYVNLVLNQSFSAPSMKDLTINIS